jgi:HlyD family secretion protein
VKKPLFFLLFLGIVLAVAVWWFNSRRTTAAEAERYTLAPAEYGGTAEVVSATGLVQPRDTYLVGTELSGKVVEVLADYNQVVREGDVLLRLDDRQARQRLKQAELAVDLARACVREAEAARDTAAKLVESERQRSPEVRRQVDLDLAESKLKSAEVAVEVAQVRVKEAEEARAQAQLGLSLTTVTAPVLQADKSLSVAAANRDSIGMLVGAGEPAQPRRTFIVLDRKVSLNQIVGPPASAHLFTLAGDLDPMQVKAQVAEGDVAKITRGQTARFTVSGTEDNVPAFEGKVEDYRLLPINERGAVFYDVIIDVANQRDPATGEWRLRPGQTATVDIVRRVHDPVWKVPASALSFQPAESWLTEAAKAKLAHWQNVKDHDQWKPVWVVDSDGKPWPIFIRVGGRNASGETGIQDAQATEVLEWDPELSPKPDPNRPETIPQLIIGVPPPAKGGLFHAPKIML